MDNKENEFLNDNSKISETKNTDKNNIDSVNEKNLYDNNLEKEKKERDEISQISKEEYLKKYAPVEITNKDNEKSKPKRKKKRVVKTTIVISIILLLSALFAFLIIKYAGDMIGLSGSGVKKSFEIPKGSNIKQIAKILEKEGIIDSDTVFTMYCKINGAGSGFLAGKHTFYDAMSYNDIIEELKVNRSSQDQISVTFPEGTTLRQAAEILEKKKICNAKELIETFNNYEDETFDYLGLIEKGGLKFYDKEGYFFPDTYLFYEDTDPKYICEIITLTFNKKVYQPFYAKMVKKNLSLDQTLALASIIQKEATSYESMQNVSSIFWNRLNNSDVYPKLQSDPTRKYVEEVIKPNISLGNEEMYTAYNTYEGNGLPPGPICNPGVDAIKAALNPSNTDYYFFCNNVKTQEFFYAKTYSEHQVNLEKAGIEEN